MVVNLVVNYVYEIIELVVQMVNLGGVKVFNQVCVRANAHARGNAPPDVSVYA